jgi:predicted O-linked N-acetylglucosamine transferase (SPINDLY family)
MNILKGLGNCSVVLLARHNPLMECNLRREAAKSAIEPERLVSVDLKLSFDNRLEQLSEVDLYLDSADNSDSCSVCEALLARIPSVCMYNGSGSSILRSIDLHPLIAHSLHEYEELAISLQFDDV